MENQEIIETLSYLSKNHLTKIFSSTNLQEKEQNLKIAYKTIDLAQELDYFPKDYLKRQMNWFDILTLNSGLDISKLKWMKSNKGL